MNVWQRWCVKQGVWQWCVTKRCVKEGVWRCCVTKMVCDKLCDKEVCDSLCDKGGVCDKLCDKDGVWQIVWQRRCVTNCVTQMCDKEGVWQRCVRQIVWQRRVWQILWQRLRVTKMVCDKLCYKEGVWQIVWHRCVTKKVCDKDVCDKLCDEEGYDKLCDHTMTWGKRWCVTKLCVKDGVCVCGRLCVTKLCVTKSCVKGGVWQRGGGRTGEAEDGRYRSKNKSPTQCCGKKGWGAEVVWWWCENARFQK